MEITTSRTGGTLNACFQGSFTFSDNARFRPLVDQLQNPEITAIIIDMTDVSFVDSAALGMLLLIRDEAEQRQIHLTLCGATAQPAKMFALSRFDLLFNLA